MKKIFLLLILLILSGCSKVEEVELCKDPYFEYKTGECCLDKNSDKICDVDEKKSEEIKETKEEFKVIEEQSEEIITLGKGDSTIVYNKEIELIEFNILDNRLDIELLVNNKKSLFKETKKSELNSGLEIQLQKIEPLKHKATFKIKRFELKDNEYIIYVNQLINIKGYDIDIENIDINDNTAIYKIKQANMIVKQGRLMVGHTLELKDLKITNIKSFFHDQRSDRYGLFRVE